MTSIDYCLDKARAIPYRKHRSRHYAVVLDKRGKIVGEGANSYTKTSPKMLEAGSKVGLKDKIYWHAECKAIYSARNLNKAYKLIVVRINSEDKPVYSKPCVLCEALIKEAGVKIIEYSV